MTTAGDETTTFIEGIFRVTNVNHLYGIYTRINLSNFQSLDKNVEYSERLRQELNVIVDRGFSKYFLTMKAIADKANDNMLSGPGRGSAAGSLVAYALGITQVDPIKYGLQFERFLTKGGSGYPDIDYDVADPMVLKEELIQDWGDDTVVPITNWNTLQLRSLVKDISKFYGVPFNEVNEVTGKMIFEATPLAKKEHGITAGVYNPTFEELMKYSETLKKFLKKYPNIKTHVESLYGQVPMNILLKKCSPPIDGFSGSVLIEKRRNFLPPPN